MDVPRLLWRRRAALLLAAAIAAAAAAVGLTSLGASRAGAEPAAQPSPVVDADYLYQQLYTMATSYSYRVSGADGPPQSPADPFNLPPTVNGWQELFGYWKGRLTDTQTNGALAAFATASDHYFQRSGGYRFQSDDAEVTIPGATCPGQRVLLASHPDETPVPSDIVAKINSGSTDAITGFGAARREITDSNLGNEGAYDGLSGVAVTLAEYHALLQWYEANNSYPKRTLKVTLLDANAKQREGSKYYAANLIPAGPQGRYVLFANMDSLGLDYPARHLGTEFFWNNITGGGVGPWFTNIKETPSAPNAAYRDTGAGSPGANIAANSAAITQLHDNLRSAVSSGFAQQGAKYAFSVPLENPLRYNQTGQAPNPYSGVVPVKPAYSAADQAQFSPVRDDTDAVADEQAFFNQGIPGFTVSGVKDSNADDNPYAASVNPGTKATPIVSYTGASTTFQIGNGTPQAPGVQQTTTSAAAAVGATTIKIGSNADLAVGSVIAIDNGNATEVRTITSIGTTGGNGTGDGITPALALAHPSGVNVALPDTALASAAAAGDAAISVGNAGRLTPGATLLIDPGPNAEVRTVQALNGTDVALNAALSGAHPNGTAVSVLEGQPQGDLGDTIEHLNYFAGGAPHGINSPSQPTEELKRALELPAQWTSLLLAGDDYAGSTAMPTTPVAYFETSPVNPATTTSVDFDASFARAADGSTSGLTYYWDFGDGTHATGKTVSHTFSGPVYADVKLAVGKAGSWGLYRQAVPVDSPAGAAPGTNACGTFSPNEAAALIAAASGGGTPAKSKEVSR
jgi:PKD domain/Peptidase family M28